jgi:hypothetical protein
MDNNQTITVGELIAILELHDPDSLISLSNTYILSNRAWDTATLLGGKNKILTVHYEQGVAIKIEPNL